MLSNPINTVPLQQFIQQVKMADMNQQKEVKLDIRTAKQLALTIGEITSKLTQDYENLLHALKNSNDNATVEIQFDGGSFEQPKQAKYMRTYLGRIYEQTETKSIIRTYK